MPHIDIGDLKLPDNCTTLQQGLFDAIRTKIVQGYWATASQIPSTRKLAEELKISRNTVSATYEQLVFEGYIESRKGSGFYVSLELPDDYLPEHHSQPTALINSVSLNKNRAFAPGVPDLCQFPLKKWQRYVQIHASRPSILGNDDVQGCYELRHALSDYLSASRSVMCNAERIIITSGAQQALSIAAMATLNSQDTLLLEYPGYVQMDKVARLFNLNKRPIAVHPVTGLDINALLAAKAKALYVTPSNQYPMGTTINTEQRLKIIKWAQQNKGWIIEDDYDSEFQFAHRPYTSMQGLAGQIGLDDHVIYIGSLSKVMFNGLRLGYMVVPEHLVARCNEIKDALTGDSPVHMQYALADFIADGELLRHIRKMRRLYKQKHQTITEAIEKHFGASVEIISQASGLHVTLRWHGGIDEETLRMKAEQQDILVRTLNYYEPDGSKGRDWRGIVLGYGNTPLSDIEPKIAKLAACFAG
ncbi:PLP-dependent aminotransferase family protein [Vibrio fluminensis]|uniref:MocR-like pyridoxine biosynthesis transcription factor PdxR n=1 Tax=Vibrio fluminensis TaxID=2783614 RepID=UPI0018886972|nr:PLP-dependent aminotransferase family protein [Vibrio fluminensis]